MHGHVPGGNGGTVVGVHDADGILVLANDILEDVCNLLGKDEAAFITWCHIAYDVLDQLSAVCTSKDDTVGVDVKEDTIHYKTNFIVGCSKK